MGKKRKKESMRQTALRRLSYARAATRAAEWADKAYEKGGALTFYNKFFEIFGIQRREVPSLVVLIATVHTITYLHIDKSYYPQQKQLFG